MFFLVAKRVQAGQAILTGHIWKKMKTVKKRTPVLRGEKFPFMRVAPSSNGFVTMVDITTATIVVTFMSQWNWCHSEQHCSIQKPKLVEKSPLGLQWDR